MAPPGRSRFGRRPICKACRRSDKFDFNVPDELWRKVVPAEHHNHFICLDCFDEFAFRKSINYCDSIGALYFAGSQAMFRFQRVSGRNAA